MKCFINLCLILVLFFGKIEAMVCAGDNNDSWVKLDKIPKRNEIRRNDPFHELNSAMENNYNDLVKVLAKEACRNRFRDFTQEQKAALLFYAVENNLEEVVEDCADSRFDLEAREWYGKTPLLLAVELGYDSIAEYLLTSGADPNALDTRTGFSALMFASWRGNRSLVMTLIRSKANVNALSYLGCSPLSLAMGSNHQEIVEILRHAGANVNLENQNGDTPMSIALYYYHKLAENERERTQWNAMIKTLRKWNEPQEETAIIKPSAWSSVRSFFKSLFRRKNSNPSRKKKA